MDVFTSQMTTSIFDLHEESNIEVACACKRDTYTKLLHLTIIKYAKRFRRGKIQQLIILADF